MLIIRIRENDCSLAKIILIYLLYSPYRFNIQISREWQLPDHGQSRSEKVENKIRSKKKAINVRSNFGVRISHFQRLAHYNWSPFHSQMTLKFYYFPRHQKLSCLLWRTRIPARWENSSFELIPTLSVLIWVPRVLLFGEITFLPRSLAIPSHHHGQSIIDSC